jgi:hypothetical protein
MILSESQQFVSPEEALEHFGIKGMRWGVRKQEEARASLSPRDGGAIMRKDGSVDIPAGSSIQRLIRSSGKSLPMKDITYASINDYDNSRYIKVIGGKGFFGGGRDRILHIQTTKPIKAPPVKDATKLVSDLMLNNSTFRERNTNILGATISKKELESIRKDPTGKTAQDWYFNTNQKLTFSREFDPHAPYIQKVVREKVQEKGYNALRDENDIQARIAKAPLIIFNPQDSLKVVRVSNIDDQLRKANKQKLKQYKRAGKEWVESQLHSQP